MADSSERPGLFRRLLGTGPAEEKVRTARYPLQAYGKLPIYKDFISVGLTDPASKEFRQWLDRGFSYRWAENAQYRDTEIPPHGFLLRLPESKSCVAGVLWGSSDEGGLRKFPFVVFLSFPAAQPAADPLAALHYLAALERRCEEIRDGYAAGASLSAFYKAFRGAEFECALKTREQTGRELKAAIGDFPVSDFAESLFGPRAAARWPAFLAALEGAAGRPNGRGAIRLPLGGVLPRAREVAVWLRWLERFDAKHRRPVTGVLYTGGRGRGRVVLFFRDLSPEDFLLLHPTHSGHAQIFDVGAPEEEAPPPAAEAPVAPPAALESQIMPASPPPAIESVGTAAPETARAPAPSSADAPAPAEAVADKLKRESESSPEAAPAEPLPFPEAQASEAVASFGPRETFSALVLPVAGITAPAAADLPQASPIVPDPKLAAPTEPEPAPEEPLAAAPAGWNRPLYALLGL